MHHGGRKDTSLSERERGSATPTIVCGFKTSCHESSIILDVFWKPCAVKLFGQLQRLDPEQLNASGSVTGGNKGDLNRNCGCHEADTGVHRRGSGLSTEGSILTGYSVSSTVAALSPAVGELLEMLAVMHV